MKSRCGSAATLILLIAISAAGAETEPYKNFKVTVSIPVQVVERMGHDPAWMESSWKTISDRLHADKVFIENYRSGTTADDATLDRVKQFFQSHNVEVAGGMALLGPGGGGAFRTLDYTDPKDRALVERVSAQAARHFDEFVLDDLFFFNTKSDSDIATKGRRSWDEFRMQTMDEVSRDLILKPAVVANPKVRVIIKFPNFYPSFQGMGFDLEQQPKIFPEIWTGDETRDPLTTDQQLQQYESYEIFRYFENIASGRNGGGWVDPPGDRTAWQMWPTTFDYFQMVLECCSFPGSPNAKSALLADAAAYALRRVDQVAGDLGAPVGLSAYRPYHSSGEDFAHEVLGMAGIPIEMFPEWPQSKTVLLTEAAKQDPDIVTKIEQHLRAGQNVIMTSGLLRAVQDRGMEQIADMRVTGNVLEAIEYVEGFGFGGGAVIGTSDPILFPEIHFYTNEDWAVVRGLANGRDVPLLLTDHYGQGELDVLTLPESLNDLYRLPTGVLDALRRYLSTELPVKLEGPAKVSLFEYNNGTFVVESFLDHPVAVRISGSFGHLQNLTSRVTLAGEPLPSTGMARFIPRPSGAGAEARQ